MTAIDLSFFGYGLEASQLRGNPHATSFSVDLETGVISTGPETGLHVARHGNSNLDTYTTDYDGMPSYAIQQRDRQLYLAAFFYPHAANGDQRGGPPANVMLGLPEGLVAPANDMVAVLDKLRMGFEQHFIVKGSLHKPSSTTPESLCHDIIGQNLDAIKSLRPTLQAAEKLSTSVTPDRDFTTIRELKYPETPVNGVNYNTVMQAYVTQSISEFLSSGQDTKSIVVVTPAALVNMRQRRSYPHVTSIDFQSVSVPPKQDDKTGLSGDFLEQALPSADVVKVADAHGQNIRDGLTGLTTLIHIGGPEGAYAQSVLSNIVAAMQQGAFKAKPKI